MFRKSAISLALAATALFSGASNATIQYTDPQSVDTGLQLTTGAVTNLVFNQYDNTNPADPWFGLPLHNVELTLDADGWAAYTIHNGVPATTGFQFTADITVSVANPGGGNLVVSIPQLQDIPRTLQALGDPGDTYTSPGYTPFDTALALNGFDSRATTYVGAGLTAPLAALFSGTGTVSLPTSAGIAIQYNANNDTDLKGDKSRYDALLSIRYSYDAPTVVPEPATLSLMGLGLAGLAASRRRKAK